ncbi:MAG: hypothetical protein ABFD50_12525 [Smithella sp.]
MRYESKLNSGQAKLLLDLQEGRIFPVHRELRFFLYVGILLIIAGAGLTIKQYFVDLGDAAVISALTLCSLTAFIYCFVKGSSYERGEITSPDIAFDYILFFGCVFYSMVIAYIDTRYHLLGNFRENYLLISVALFFFLAYRFDNRLVLSMALSTLAAWFGFTLSVHRFHFEDYYRLYAIAYALIVLCSGILLYRAVIKKHFLDIYLNFAIHFLCIALISGVIEYKILSLYFPVLLAACAALAYHSIQTRKFLYMLYAVIYGYIGISIVVVDQIHGETFLVFVYFIVTSALMIGFIFKLSRKFNSIPDQR